MTEIKNQKGETIGFATMKIKDGKVNLRTYDGLPGLYSQDLEVEFKIYRWYDKLFSKIKHWFK